MCNSSGSYWEIRKLDFAFEMMSTATARLGGAYAFSNLVGCDGSRLCFAGRSLISINGSLVARTSDRSDLFKEVQVAVADVDVQSIDAYRALGYRRPQPHTGVGDTLDFHSVKGYQGCCTVNPLSKLTVVAKLPQVNAPGATITRSVARIHMSASQEIHYYGSLWLWDYLRRCPAATGFIIPLSGGADSSSVACLVYGMCHLVWESLRVDPSVTPRIRKLFELKDGEKLTAKFEGPRDLCRKLLLCVYLKTKYSGRDTEDRAQQLAHLLGAEFRSHDMHPVYEQMLGSQEPSVAREEVTLREQNLQARLRMVHTYFFADSRLVLSSGNVDEALVGYLTKYGCSSGDLNPIGSISKQDLKQFLHYMEQTFFPGSQVMTRILTATPSAELTGEDQSDEEDLQLTYKQLSLFGRFRKGKFGACGPYSMFTQLWQKRHEFDEVRSLSAVELATKVKRFFQLHAKTRHKTTVLTPALHAETYSPDDNRFDHRQFLFDAQWTWQFAAIDEAVRRVTDS